MDIRPREDADGPIYNPNTGWWEQPSESEKDS